MRLPLRVLLATALAASFTGGGQLAAKPSDKADLSSVSTEDLISRFQEVSQEGTGSDTVMNTKGVIARKYRFMGNPPLGFTFSDVRNFVALPMVSPVMRELVRRGPSVVPALLDHLTDARPTRLVVQGSGNTGGVRIFGDQYDPRNPHTKHLPPGLRNFDEPNTLSYPYVNDFTNYQVRVGDLCFVALGQIVNRRLTAVEGVPTGIIQVNSPVRAPELAEATRADWAGLISDAFKAHLISDLNRLENNWTNIEAFKRLQLYYPQDSIAIAVRLLNRPVCNVHPLRDLTKKLYLTGDEKEQGRLLTEIQTKCGEVGYQAAVQGQSIEAGSPPPDKEMADVSPESVTSHDNAVKLVNRRFPSANKNPGFSQLMSLSCGEQIDVIEAVAAISSSEIDQAMRDLLARTLALQPDNPSDKLSQCELASACLQRFATPALRRAIAKAGDELNKNMPQDGADARTNQAYMRRLDRFLQTWTQKLPPASPPPAHEMPR